MKESIGGSLLLSVVVIMLGSLIAVFAASFAYSKAFKAKNLIIDTIHDYNGDITEKVNENITSETIKGTVLVEISNQISNIGYRPTRIKCPRRHGTETLTSSKRQGDNGYCIYKVKQTNDMNNEGYYYEVMTYMYFDIPLLNFKLPVYGQTRTYQPSPKNIYDEEDIELDNSEEDNDQE